MLTLIKNNKLIVEEVDESKTGEEEALKITKKVEIEYIITDDLKAMRDIEKEIGFIVFSSSFLIFTLCRLDALTKSEGWHIIETMRFYRDWKNNVIYETAKELWKNL